MNFHVLFKFGESRNPKILIIFVMNLVLTEREMGGKGKKVLRGSGVHHSNKYGTKNMTKPLSIIIFKILEVGFEMKKLILILVVEIATSISIFSQEMGLYWYLSNNWGLDFNTCNGEPVISNNFPPNYPRDMQVGVENAVVTDSVGNILFTTDGFLVWDRMGNAVDDTLVPVTGNLFSWDDFDDIYPVVLVPFWDQWRKNYFYLYWPVDPTMCRVFRSPLDRNKYFIFTVSRWKYDYNNRIFRWDGIPGYRFFYSIVELNPENGNVEVSSKGNLLFDKNCGVTAFEFIPHKNGRDLWLVLSGSIIDSLEDTPENPLYYIDTFRVF